MSESVITPWHPSDGRAWASQCARCGSSTYWTDCHECGGDGWYDDEDDCGCVLGKVHCGWCDGRGGWELCISSREFCEANPMPGRENERGIEWFVVEVA